jgi:hypothetical protein
MDASNVRPGPGTSVVTVHSRPRICAATTFPTPRIDIPIACSRPRIYDIISDEVNNMDSTVVYKSKDFLH